MFRLNARVRPSGEKAGELSPANCAGGDVTLRFSPVSIDSRNKGKGSARESLSLITSELPSGDQAKSGPGKNARPGLEISASLRSGPPKAGIRSSADFSRENSRRNAM